MSKADDGEACSGDGILKIEMHFLPDVYVPCEVCKGKRYNRETLEVKYKGKSIYDVLKYDGGRGSAFSLNMCRRSGGKWRPCMMWGCLTSAWGSPPLPCPAERRKGSSWRRSLASAAPEGRVYILDEPTTGLHFADVHKLTEIPSPAVCRRQHCDRHRAQPGCDQNRPIIS